MKSDKIEVAGNGMRAVVQANSSPAFYVCIFVAIVALWSVFSRISWPFIAIVSVVAAVFIYLLIFKPQNMMDSKTLFEWTKTFLGDRDNPISIEADIVKTETISAKSSITKKK